MELKVVTLKSRWTLVVLNKQELPKFRETTKLNDFKLTKLNPLMLPFKNLWLEWELIDKKDLFIWL